MVLMAETKAEQLARMQASYQERKSAMKAGRTAQVSGPVWPTTHRVITQDCHEGHIALDMRAPMNSPIRATFGGQVEKVIPMDSRGYGNLIIVKSPTGMRTFYAHLNAFSVREGQQIKPGQMLGLAGSTGNSTASHLHLEFRDDQGRHLNPYSVLGSDLNKLSTPANLDSGIAAELARTVKNSRQNTQTPVYTYTGGVPVEAPQKPFKMLTPEAAAKAGVSRYLPSGFYEYQADPEAVPEGSIKLLGTPIGDVRISSQPWLNIAAVGAGGLLILISIIFLMKPYASTLLPEAAGAIHPAAGAVAKAVM
jgi:murein DD-endopeptidase MepM/ murein hydrolase activator NlpD